MVRAALAIARLSDRHIRKLVMTNIALFLLAALVIGAAGVRLTSKARYIARTTGLGEALLGGVVIGAITSLAGTVTS